MTGTEKTANTSEFVGGVLAAPGGSIPAFQVGTTARAVRVDGTAVKPVVLDPLTNLPTGFGFHWENAAAIGLAGYGVVKGNWWLAAAGGVWLVFTQGGPGAVMKKLGLG